MMKPIRPQISKGASYPQEFREEAVQYWLSSGQTLLAVASDLGLSPECLRSWRKQIEAAPPQAVVSGQGGHLTNWPQFVRSGSCVVSWRP